METAFTKPSVVRVA